MASSEQARLLSEADISAVTRLLKTSEYIYQRFMFEELPSLLRHYPAVGMFSSDTLRSFLLTQTLNPPSAWIGGFGVSWTESRAYLAHLDKLLEYLIPLLTRRGTQQLFYSGNDLHNDWLRDALLPRGFAPFRQLYSYDKFDYKIPSTGNQEVLVRPFEPRDIPALLNIEEGCFEQLWRYDAISFLDIAETHPYFVVAELQGKVVGYQFNTNDGEFGYLVRIAVHPSASGKGIGVRLMSEAIQFFRSVDALRIMLNTQDDNIHAHRLYEWFGFIRIPQIGFVLRKTL